MSKNNDFVSAAPNTNNNDFLDSLETLSIDDVVPPHRKRVQSGGFSLFMISRLAIVVLCIAVFCYCISELSGIVTDYQRGEDLYGDISKEFNTILNGNTEGNVSQIELSVGDIPMASYSNVLMGNLPIYAPIQSGVDRVTSGKFQAILSLIQGWSAKNGDIFGYIRIPNSKIDYPMVHCANNEFYLTHAFDGHPSAVGAIFVDFRNNRNIENNQNVIIYGHNMQSGKMFGSLNKYSNKEYYEEHPKFEFDTIYEKGAYEIVYVFRSKIYNEDVVVFKYYQFLDAQSEQEFNSNMAEMAKISLYDTGITPEYGDELLTLSTCDYQENNGRFVIVARKIK
jgi:SrtB family sortase